MLLRLWKFVANSRNRAILSWLGGGAVVVVVGAWTLFTHFHADNKPAASTTTVIAPAATGITSGHDTVVNAPVTIGLDEKRVGQQVSEAQKPLTEQLEKLATQVARDKGVEVAPLRSILVKLGEAGVSDEDIAKRLDGKADELIKLRAEIAKLRQGPAELAAYAQQAQALIDKGDFDGARAALASGQAAAHAMREQSSRYEAQFLAQDAGIDHLQIAYRSAAKKYADAARLMETVDQREQWEFLIAQAGELYNLGDEFGDSAALVEAIAGYRNSLLLAPRSQRSLDWATTQNSLGEALVRLGERESGTARLEEAVAAFRDALKEYTPEREPLDWAMIQNNLGNALEKLGESENDTARFEEAVAAYHDALKEFTPERVTLDWAMTQNNLGSALVRLAESENDTARLEEAVAAFRDALKELTPARVPLYWAMTQDNLGSALVRLGEVENDTARLEEAVAAFRDALKEYTRERVPLQWAMSTGNQGVALGLLAGRRSDLAMAELAVSQITTAFETCSAAHHTPYAAYYESQLPAARALVERLRKG
jgi:tetratricopeptide (TPR) repeat protein